MINDILTVLIGLGSLVNVWLAARMFAPLNQRDESATEEAAWS